MESWRAYKSDYLLAAHKVEDRSEQEERELLFGKLPAEWQKSVIDEDGKRGDRATRWVRVTQLPPMREEEVKDDLETLAAQRIKSCQEHAPRYLVEAYTEEGVKALLLLNNVEVLPGRRIRSARHENAMTAQDIFEHISHKLLQQLRWTTHVAERARPATPNSPENRGDISTGKGE